MRFITTSKHLLKRIFSLIKEYTAIITILLAFVAIGVGAYNTYQIKHLSLSASNNTATIKPEDLLKILKEKDSLSFNRKRQTPVETKQRGSLFD